MAKVSNVGGLHGGIHLEVFLKSYSLRRFAARPSGWIVNKLGLGFEDTSDNEKDVLGEASLILDLDLCSSLNLCKKNLFLQVEWILSK